MKFYHLVLVTMLLLGTCGTQDSAQPHTNATAMEAEVEAAFEELVSATKNGDHGRYFDLFDTETFTALNADGSTLPSFDAFKDLYAPQLGAVKRYQSLEFDPIHIRIIDANTAVLVNEYSAEVELTSGTIVSASGAGAQIWSKRSGEWKLVHISDAQKR